MSKGYGVPFRDNKNILKLIVVMDAQHSDYAKAFELCTLNG